ncbi:hydrogenase iron-sulfur subunit [bacterium]|nr:hydrogenase iron-sulfur subunit [bacterium]
MSWKARKPRLSRLLSRVLEPLEKALHRLFGERYNPTYQSGVLALYLLGLVVVSGLPLLFFYRVGSPYESTRWIAQSAGLAWLRSIHRYASDAAMLAVIWHVVRMLLGGRTAGPRRRAWISGILLTALLVVIGVVGLILVWDVQAQHLAQSSMRLIEGLPIFSESPRRVFADPKAVGESFFFMLIFLHVALPLVLVFLVLFHTSRVARARLWPEAYLARYYGAALLLLAVFWPPALAQPADLLQLPGPVRLDVFYAFWMPLVELWGPSGGLAALTLLTGLLASVPWWWKPEVELTSQASFVDEDLCTGCTQCFQDCPYDAIAMVERKQDPGSRRSLVVARVDSDLCVSCGICTASCAPMGVGPPGRTGREQLREAQEWSARAGWQPGEVAVLACRWGCGESPGWDQIPGLRFMATGCSGSVHTSVIEFLLRAGATGVMIVSCPERDCSHREGPKWLQLRVYHVREAELQARVDRRRVRLLACPGVDVGRAVREAQAFGDELKACLVEPVELPTEEPRCKLEEEAS